MPLSSALNGLRGLRVRPDNARTVAVFNINDEFYDSPHGRFKTSSGAYLPCPPSPHNSFRKKALLIAEDMVASERIGMPHLRDHLERCYQGDRELAISANMAALTAETKQELLEKTKKYLCTT